MVSATNVLFVQYNTRTYKDKIYHEITALIGATATVLSINTQNPKSAELIKIASNLDRWSLIDLEFDLSVWYNSQKEYKCTLTDIVGM